MAKIDNLEIGIKYTNEKHEKIKAQKYLLSCFLIIMANLFQNVLNQ